MKNNRICHNASCCLETLAQGKKLKKYFECFEHATSLHAILLVSLQHIVSLDVDSILKFSSS
eukprot:c26933_g1_i1 orf=1-183(-)